LVEEKEKMKATLLIYGDLRRVGRRKKKEGKSAGQFRRGGRKKKEEKDNDSDKRNVLLLGDVKRQEERVVNSTPSLAGEGRRG